jgi:hypothetical protein
MKLDIERAMSTMTDQEIFDIAKTARSKLIDRFRTFSNYEPTGDPEIDQEHNRRLQDLRNKLAQLGELS